MIKKLTKEIEEICGCKIIWELGKKYEAFNEETYELVAIYNPKNGKLIINK